MNCEMVCFLADDYLENRLGRRDRRRFENHLAACSECADEIRQRPAFDQKVWRALTEAKTFRSSLI